MKKDKSIYPVTVFIAVLAGIALLAPLLAPNDPSMTNLTVAGIGPCKEFPLGTDNLGRCMLSRVIYGGRISIFASLLVTLIVFTIGVTVGSICGYFGGIVDAVLNKFITIMQSFPQIVLAIAITGILGIGIKNTIIALSMVLWVDYARLARNFVFSIKGRTFIKAAKICGESDFKILFKRVIPNIIPPLIVNAGMGIASTIMEIAALSYLGVGAKESQPEWGAMINLGKNYMHSDIKMVIIPGLAIFFTAAAFNLFSEKLRDRLI